MLRRRDFCAIAALSLTLTACDLEERDPSASLATSANTSSATKDGWSAKARTVEMFGGEFTFRVGPAVKTAQNTVLRLQVTTNSSEFENLSGRWAASSDNPGLADLVMLDLKQRLAFLEMQTQSLNIMVSDISPLETYAVFGKTSADSVSLYLPTVGVFTDIPVLALNEQGAFNPTDFLSDAILDTDRSAGVSLDYYCESYSNAMQMFASDSLSTVTLSTDVIFKENSAKLTDDAQIYLTTVAQQLKSATPGTVSIVGHTADAGESEGKTRSQQYAMVVKKQLKALGALKGWQVNVQGVGASEPRAVGDAEYVQAANRRVEIAIDSPKPASVPFPSIKTISLPKAPVQTATGSAGVDLLFGKQPVHISLAEVTRKSGYLYGNLSITAGEEGVSTLLGAYLANTDSAYNQRLEMVDMHYAWCSWSLALISSGMRIYPVDYSVHTDSQETSFHVPLSGNLGGVSLGPGEQVTVPIIWPDTGQQTLILDLQAAAERGSKAASVAFRLVEIPVV